MNIKETFWRTYKLEEDSDINFRSIEHERDNSKEGWIAIQTQIFEFGGNLYLSVLYNITQ